MKKFIIIAFSLLIIALVLSVLVFWFVTTNYQING